MDRKTASIMIDTVAAGLREKARWVRWIQAVLILNCLDLMFTVYYIEAGRAVEANPLMAAAYEISPFHFGILKTALALLGITLLYRARHARTAQLAIRGVAIAYAVLVGYHLVHFPIGEFEGLLVGLL